MTLKETLDSIVKHTINNIKLRREYWEYQIEKTTERIKKLKQERREFKESIIIENELLKKYEEIDFDEILDNISSNKTHIPR